jgi:hypothetical protein
LGEIEDSIHPDEITDLMSLLNQIVLQAKTEKTEWLIRE